jgi:protein subunit release factor B
MTTHATDRESLELECEMEFFVAGGPGGQHRNKVETGVRLTHRPTGLVVTATERRSQSANERMAEKLEERQRVRKPRRATRPSAGSKIRRRVAKTIQSQRKKSRGRLSGDE